LSNTNESATIYILQKFFGSKQDLGEATTRGGDDSGGGGNLRRAHKKNLTCVGREIMGAQAGKSRGNSLDSQRPKFAFNGERKIRDDLYAILQNHIANLLGMNFFS
jgi:hypothetical protein